MFKLLDNKNPCTHNFTLTHMFILTFICPFLGPPEPPENIAVLVLSLTSVRVEWDSGFTGLLQCTFHLQYRAEGDTDWSEMTLVPVNKHDRQAVEITGLVQYTNYIVQMFTSNANGVSATTQNIYFSISGKRMNWVGTCIQHKVHVGIFV